MSREAKVLYQVISCTYVLVNLLMRKVLTYNTQNVHAGHKHTHTVCRLFILLNFSAYSQLFGAEQNSNEDASSPTKYCLVVRL